MVTSFPYLAIAKFFQVDYGRVLAQAELLDHYPPKPQDWSLQDWQVATITAWRTEQERRKAAQPQMVQWSMPNDITSWVPDPSTRVIHHAADCDIFDCTISDDHPCSCGESKRAAALGLPDPQAKVGR